MWITGRISQSPLRVTLREYNSIQYKVLKGPVALQGDSLVFNQQVGEVVVMAYADGNATLNAGKEIVKFNITTVTDIASTSSMSFSFYPNPANEQLIIDAEDEVSYRIISMKGSVTVSGTNAASNVINTSSLSSGVYMLKLSSQNEQVVEKLVIQHNGLY